MAAYLTAPVSSTGFKDATNGRLVTWNGKSLVHSPIARCFAKLTMLDIAGFSIGSTYHLAPIHVGDRNVSNSANAQILISRNVTNPSSTSEHAFSDSSNVVGGNASMGYNSFDSRINYTGTASFDHYAGFQASPTYASSGTMADMYLHTCQPTASAGTITNLYGYYMHNCAGGGTVTNQYGVYIAALSKGSTANWAIYTAGTTPSYFGGPVKIGSSGSNISTIITGTYTPTLTSVTNIEASTSNVCRYTRIGSRVRVSGVIAIDPTTAAGTNSEIGISLPVAATFTNTEDLAGVGASRDNGPGLIVADTSNNRARMVFVANSAANGNWAIQFEYDV